MKSKFFRSTVACCTAFVMILSLAACGGPSSQTTETKTDATNSSTETKSETKEETKAPVTIKFMVNDTGDGLLKEREDLIYKPFIEKNKDSVNLQYEIVTGGVDNMITKIKMQIASNDVPDIFNVGGYDLVGIADKAGAIIDMMPYLNADPELKSWISKENLTQASNSGGKFLTYYDMKNVMGYYYNKEMFEKAGIKPAETWEEFWSNCDKLKAAGFTPLTLDTAETAWETNLLLGAIISGKSQAGFDFMHTIHPKDYNVPEVVGAFADIKKAFQQYATKNAAGAGYDAGANNFLSEKTAMAFNGPWMANDFVNKDKVKEGFDKKVGVALYPNKTVYASSSTAYCVGKHGKDKEDASMKFIKYLASPEVQLINAEKWSNYPDNPTVKLSDSVKEKQALLAQLYELEVGAQNKIVDYQSQWYPNICDAFTTLYPELIFDKVTPEDIAKKFNELSGKNKQ